MDMRVGLQRKLSTKELLPLNCGFEGNWESLGLEGDPTVHPKGNQSWMSYGFPVVMYGCESWIIKKAECQRIDAFELWYWRRLLKVLWTARRSNQLILKNLVLNIHWKNWCLKLKLQYFYHLMLIIGKDPDVGKDWRLQEKAMTTDKMVGWNH